MICQFYSFSYLSFSTFNHEHGTFFLPNSISWFWWYIRLSGGISDFLVVISDFRILFTRCEFLTPNLVERYQTFWWYIRLSGGISDFRILFTRCEFLTPNLVERFYWSLNHNSSIWILRILLNILADLKFHLFVYFCFLLFSISGALERQNLPNGKLFTHQLTLKV